MTAILLCWPSGCDCLFGHDESSSSGGCTGGGYDYDAGGYDAGPVHGLYGDCAETACTAECAARGMLGQCTWTGAALECRCVADPVVGCDPDECAARCGELGYERWACSDVGCRCYNTAPEPADAGTDASRDARHDAGADADAPDADDPCGPDECPNDPPDGPVGTPCAWYHDCAPGFACIDEWTDVYDGESYRSWAGGTCVPAGVSGEPACDPSDPLSCPAGARCAELGLLADGRPHPACLDACAARSETGAPWTTNCDCREGYRCARREEVCLPGCSNDRECCEVWHDADADRRRSADEVTLLGPDRCLDTCDACTYACTSLGCPGGDCRVGDFCEYDVDCPRDGACLVPEAADADGVPGLCVREGCDLPGGECPADAGCTAGSLPEMAAAICARPCEVGTSPGDPGFACADLDPPGPSAGDHACTPLEPEDWFDGATATGFCWPGRFGTGTGAVGSPCAEDPTCSSPAGLGLCLTLDRARGICSRRCSTAGAATGLCEFGAPASVAGGVCWDRFCWRGCAAPGAPLFDLACGYSELACYPIAAFAGTAVATGRDPPAGVCLPRCLDDAWCRAFRGAGTCDRSSGLCLWTP